MGCSLLINSPLLLSFATSEIVALLRRRYIVSHCRPALQSTVEGSTHRLVCATGFLSTLCEKYADLRFYSYTAVKRRVFSIQRPPARMASPPMVPFIVGLSNVQSVQERMRFDICDDSVQGL